MIRFTPPQLKAIVDAAEAAFPAECCGLIVGVAEGADAVRVTAVHPSPNLALAATGRRDRFEVDPRLRLRLHRELRGGAEAVIGLYHSHPGHPPEPSATDLAMAWEPELIWVIVAVAEGQAIQVAAHRLAPEGRRFIPVPLALADTAP